MSPAGLPWWQASAVALVAAYRGGAVTPTQVLAACFERIDAVNPQLNALIALRRDAAFADAARSDERFARGAPLARSTAFRWR